MRSGPECREKCKACGMNDALGYRECRQPAGAWGPSCYVDMCLALADPAPPTRRSIPYNAHAGRRAQQGRHEDHCGCLPLVGNAACLRPRCTRQGSLAAAHDAHDAALWTMRQGVECEKSWLGGRGPGEHRAMPSLLDAALFSCGRYGTTLLYCYSLTRQWARRRTAMLPSMGQSSGRRRRLPWPMRPGWRLQMGQWM